MIDTISLDIAIQNNTFTRLEILVHIWLYYKLRHRVVFIWVFKTKTKAAIMRYVNNTMNQADLEANSFNRRQARKNAESKSRLVLVLVEKIARGLLANQRKKIIQNQNNYQLLSTALLPNVTIM